ncbi:MAG: succinate dehydrogenase/fumarate reductase iron-sulfur subunit [Algoriphagus sp.]|uniref:succinate dehydrogenase/fumarate reductase iron-sulfur subunit n=1 Tax=Algoriphagus sp. TaxID=1872435 RepID=UPI0027311C2F|nr:succinate dehydrogenase/fumarate reductase iron-sulfur subunit [Algoriphagus sp.]MDP2042811.1 succinate dehydrogenase/fumarate reductase iron-sulfur subunit [Algoriphagus sp.]MDP3473758.1 succinate dehydrogenase/fumarate reductase iron-sulfur subunit [Algoriphagus sp.]
MQLKLRIWRQAGPQAKGYFEDHSLDELDDHMSVPEMLDLLNTNIIKSGGNPIAFESDCREGICGQCGFVINGDIHSPNKGTTTCQTHLRSFKDGQTLVIEPFRAAAFPIKKDLMIDRSAFDRIIQAGGYIGVNTGQAPEANTILIKHDLAERAFDAAACIGCGACVAVCKNASAMLFTSAKVNHLSMLPQGAPEAAQRVTNMVKKMDAEGFGSCSYTGACEAVCPQGISITNIAAMNGRWLWTQLTAE